MTHNAYELLHLIATNGDKPSNEYRGLFMRLSHNYIDYLSALNELVETGLVDNTELKELAQNGQRDFILKLTEYGDAALASENEK